MKKNGWTDRRAELAYFLVGMLRDALCVSAVILVWEACHGFHSGYLHIDDIEVRVRDERGGFVRRYDHAGRGELAARDGSDGEDGEWTCAAVFDDDARRLTVTLQHVDARPRRKGSEGKQEVEQAHQDVNHGEDYTETRRRKMKMEGRSDEMLAAALLQYAEERTVEIRDALDKIIRVIAAVEKTRIGKANETWACVDVGTDLVASKNRVKALLLEYAAVIDKGVDIPVDGLEGPSHACDVRDMAHILAVHREFLFDELVGRYFTRKSQEMKRGDQL